MQMDHTYHYDLSGKFSFGDLPEETMIELFRDGRVASFFMERQLCLWFPELIYKNAKGHDHVDDKGVKYDAKGFTKGGLTYAPSKMLGVGRRIDEAQLHEHAQHIIYTCVDVVEFPRVRVRFVRGTDLIQRYPEGKIPLSDREQFYA
jgi:hypothetical protein